MTAKYILVSANIYNVCSWGCSNVHLSFGSAHAFNMNMLFVLLAQWTDISISCFYNITNLLLGVIGNYC